MGRERPAGAGVRLHRWIAWAALPVASVATAQVAVLDCGADGTQPMVVRYFDGSAPKSVRGQVVAFRPLVRPQACPQAGACEVTAEVRKELSCRKPQGLFVFRFKPVPFSPTLQGMCGGNVTGELVVVHKDRQVLPPTLFEDPAACFDTRAESQRIRSVTVDPAGGRPVIDYAAAR